MPENTGAVTLFERDSAYDLFARGFGVQFSARTGHVPCKVERDPFWDPARRVDRTAYCAAHVRERLERADVLAALGRYGRAEINRGELLSMLGLHKQMPEVKLRLADMFAMAGYGGEFVASSADKAKATSDKIAATNMARYGGRTPMASAAVRDKMQGTMVERYGVTNISSLDSTKEKKKSTTLRNYGVDNPLKSKAVRERAEATIQARYGVRNVSQSDEIKAKKAATCMRNFGVPWSGMSPEVRARMNATVAARCGVDVSSVKGPFSVQAIRDKARESYMRGHGVDNPFKDPDVQAGIREGWLSLHGVDNPSRVPEIQARRMQTIFDRYGVDNPFRYPEFKAKARATNRVRYGVEYVSQSEEIQARVNRTKLERHTFHVSGGEEALYERLVGVFGADDVMRQYSEDARYPFACDFYVKSRDMFIELNATWTHGGHWYDAGSDTDGQVLADWSAKRDEHVYYKAGVRTWTVRDVLKRETACKNGLNYVVFWFHTIEDAELWFGMGCPDGRDWERMYSWLPVRDLSFSGGFPEDVIPWRACVRAAKAANWREFYKQELAYWDGNDPSDVSYGTPQAVLYANRYKYLGKLPSELTGNEILRGLSIGFFVDGYSSFDVTGMDEVLTRYGATSVYDPCAGWGERLTYCGSRGVRYFGCDINQAVVEGHSRIIAHYGFRDVATVWADSALFDAMRLGHDAVFTCPPYGDREIYTAVGAENLDEAGFADWWRRVVLNSIAPSTRVFAYQVDQNHKDGMNRVLLDLGWRLAETVPVGTERVSHGVRCKGRVFRKNFEEVQVFVRGSAV